MKKRASVFVTVFCYAVFSIVFTSCEKNRVTVEDIPVPTEAETDQEAVKAESVNIPAVPDPESIGENLLILAEAADFTGMERLIRDSGQSGTLDSIISRFEKEADLPEAPPRIYLALSVLYGRKGLKSKEYQALVRAEEKAARQPAVIFNIALVHGRKKLLEGAPDADTFLTGSADFRSEPPEVTVLVDGKVMGKTPLHLEKLKAGVHRITFESKGYVSENLSLDVGIGARYEIGRRLLRPGSLLEDGFELELPGDANWQWRMNNNRDLSYRSDSGTGRTGSKSFTMADLNNGDRAHMYWNFPEGTGSATVNACIRMPSSLSADLAEVQLKAAETGDLVDVQIMRAGSAGLYKLMYLGENSRGNMAWKLLADNVKADEWILVQIAFSNVRHEAEIRINGERCGIYPYRLPENITRLELNGGGWSNTVAMEVQFDDILVAPGEPSFDDTILVKGGTFMMGNPFGDGLPDQGPLHRVTLDDYYMSRAQVTAARIAATANWAIASGRAVIRGTRLYAAENDRQHLFDFSQEYRFSNLSNGFIDTTGDEPMGHGSWYLACATANWISEQKGLAPAYNLKTWRCDMKTDGYRLPTEAEWEFAARNGGKNIRYPWGDTLPAKGSTAWANLHDEDMQQKGWTQDKLYYFGYRDGYIGSNPVNAMPPSPLGFRDMYGNLWELVSDTWYEYGDKPETNPLHEGGTRFISRGSGYDLPHDPTVLPNIYTRFQQEPYTFAGFRLVRRAK